MPGRGIDLPELLTWTLGERSEFVPQLRPRKPPAVEPPLPVPATRATVADESRAVDAEMVRARLAQAATGAAGMDRDGDGIPDAVDIPADYKARLQAAQKSAEALKDQTRRARVRRMMEENTVLGGAAPSRASSGAAPPAMAPAPAAAPEAYEFDDDAQGMVREPEAVTLSAPARRGFIQKISGNSADMRSVPLALTDVTVPARAPVLSDPYLPAVSAGGLDYVYQAPTKATIASSGKQVRIPLASQTFRASAFHEATPALAATAFLRARVRNDGKRPLLRGPATIFGDGELVGVGEIQTTGPGGDIEFPLGADQDVRLVRQVVPTTKTAGVIMKTEETTYAVQIQVANYKKQKVTVEIADQVPRSRRDKVEVKLLGVQPAATGAPDADGVIRWRVELAPGATQTLRLNYQITRPKDWQLYQN
jgi:hypothetical protein